MSNVDREWFQERICERGTSQRQVAKKVGMDPAALSLMLAGKRKLDVREAGLLAVVLHQPIGEILLRAGVPDKSQELPSLGALGEDVVLRRKPGLGLTPAPVAGAQAVDTHSNDREYPSMTTYLTPEQVAQHLAIHVQTLANWRARGVGPRWVKVGRAVRYPLEDLLKFIEG